MAKKQPGQGQNQSFGGMQDPGQQMQDRFQQAGNNFAQRGQEAGQQMGARMADMRGQMADMRGQMGNFGPKAQAALAQYGLNAGMGAQPPSPPELNTGGPSGGSSMPTGGYQGRGARLAELLRSRFQPSNTQTQGG